MSEPNPSRRSFFNPRGIKRAIEQAPAEPQREPTAEEMAENIAETHVFHVSRPAMACEFEVILNAGYESRFAEQAMESLDLVERLEAQLTVYRDSSEVMAINRRAFGEPMLIERRLAKLLQTAIDLFHFTDGAFDITAGPLSKAWGFYRRQGEVPTDSALQIALENVGSDKIRLSPETCEIQFEHSGMEINLGGIGKGYALDRCAEQLTESRVHNFLLHGGQSSILARGNRTGIDKQGRAGWKIGLRHPIWHEKYLADIFLHNRALGTSGTGRQGFFHQGKRYGHIIDPRTGFPAEGVLSSTVLAPTAAEADALATAFYVLGPESSLQICQQRTDIAAIIVVPGEKQGTIELHTANLDDSEWQLYE